MKLLLGNKSGSPVWISFAYTAIMGPDGPRQQLVFAVTSIEVTADGLGERARVVSSTHVGTDGMLRRNDVPDNVGIPFIMNDVNTQEYAIDTVFSTVEDDDVMQVVIRPSGRSEIKDMRASSRGPMMAPDDIAPPTALIIRNGLSHTVHISVVLASDREDWKPGLPLMQQDAILYVFIASSPADPPDDMKVVRQKQVEPGKTMGIKRLPPIGELRISAVDHDCACAMSHRTTSDGVIGIIEITEKSGV
ncbi:MAG: hypothetical protein RLZZ324_878 [Candidatus Parcubacteria bacterium]|jgi:hypothetical protein